jgi:hypothetical protein
MIVGGIVVLNLLAQGLDRAVGGSQPTGTPASSYATRDDGLAAYASLLAHFHHAVTQQRGSIGRSALPRHCTLIVVEPTVLTGDDAATLLDFVAAGGRLVIGGHQPFYLRNLRDAPPTWSELAPAHWVEIDSALGNITSVETASEGAWTAFGTSSPLVRDGDRALVTIDHVGAGDILFLADPSPLENAYLARADNAAFAVALVGDPNRPVVFAEGVHGYGESRGLAAIPTRWKYGLAVFGLAAIVFVWSRARRFGPPDRAARELPPPRADYVRALSTTLARTHDPVAAFAPMQHWARDLVAARAALAPDADDASIVRAAQALGCTEVETAAVVAPITDDGAALALGRALARISDDGRARERTA